jgi:AraC-like DNA-binding protein
VAVRFKPGAAAYFFDLPIDALSDARVDLRELWGSEAGARMGEALWARPLSDRDRLAVLARALRSHLAARASTPSPGPVERAVKLIEAADGALRIGELSALTGLSRQHLASQFRARVGVTPKMFARLCRFRSALACIGPTRGDSAGIDWAQLAQERGYVDQSHLIHEFREFAGLSPQAYAAR